ncbi:hypothetical protein CTAYLR_000442 [Chrysophaeum taylorii]|uniref:Uncharacterized protein n=1 Tax=Chrysophaeum taylorii TaxID=2483200 RepID=A0AAD7UIM2_9STRA|nr:hypothetical protein CTAYLR_000442 [Chrysophaeum taylorii]
MSREESDVELDGVDMEEEEEEAEEEEEEYYPEEEKGPPGGGFGEGGLSKGTTKKDAAFEEARRAQRERLEKVKEQSKPTSESEKREKRLAYLMAQSEVFAHFMEESGASTGTKKKGGRTKLSEAAEDANLMRTAQSKLRVTKVLQQPKCITATLRPYQLEGLNWMVKLHDNGINGILADEMGLGKTLQSISLLAYLGESRGFGGPHICIVPKSVCNNWIRELRKWCPTLRPVKLLGSKQERQQTIKDQILPGGFDVCVTSYEGVLKEKATLCKIQWHYLLIDEAHRIKNPKSSLSKVVRLIPTQFRLLITGTPLQNNLNELWALLNFLLPDIFASEADFESWFSLGDADAKENVVKKLHTVLRPFMLRRIKKDVEKDLPPKREVKLYIGMTEMQRLWYTKILSKDAHTLNSLGGPDRVQLLNILMQLRKVCNHPYLFEGAEPGPPYLDGPHLWENAGKLVLLTKLLPKLQAQGSRVLVFSQMTRMLDILEDYMRLNAYAYCRIDGSTHGDDRDSQMDEFNRPGSPKFVFLLSTRAGGLGINLATADIVVLYDSDWNPQVDLQAMDRAHRIGQTKPVTVFRFVTEGTVEEKIIERADRKLFLDAAVIQQGRLAEQNAALSKNDLMSMVRFGADEIFNSKQATISDEDIETLLKRGEDRTHEQQAKIQSDVQHNLANFSLTTTDEAAGSLFDFEGENYRDKSKGLMINLPQRERKRNYDVDEYFRETLRPGDPKPAPKHPLEKKRKGPAMHDFQFFNKTELERLCFKEDELLAKKNETIQIIKELRKGTGEAAQRADELEATLETDFDLAPDEQRRKDELLSEGFGEWTKKDLRVFLAVTERRGRDDVDNVAIETARETGKTVEDVKRYHSVFWRRYKELADADRLIDKIEKGEKRLQRAKEIRDALAAKVARHDKPWQCLPLQYGASRGKVWTEEEDAFLINMMHQYGYGNWERIRVEIRNAWQFNFDWFFKSRSGTELSRRADLLIRLVEKENEDLGAKAAAVASKSPNNNSNGSDPGSTSKKKSSSSARKRPVKTEGAKDGRSPAAKKQRQSPTMMMMGPTAPLTAAEEEEMLAADDDDDAPEDEYGDDDDDDDLLNDASSRGVLPPGPPMSRGDDDDDDDDMDL